MFFKLCEVGEESVFGRIQEYFGAVERVSLTSMGFSGFKETWDWLLP
jgi:hypothetical protein